MFQKMKRLEKKKVLEIVADWISLNWGYTAPPKVKMDKDGNIFIDEK